MMWEMLSAEETAEISDPQREHYQDQAEKFRKSKLKDNCSPDASSAPFF